MRAELVKLNHCAVPFLTLSVLNLSKYNNTLVYTYTGTLVSKTTFWRLVFIRFSIAVLPSLFESSRSLCFSFYPSLFLFLSLSVSLTVSLPLHQRTFVHFLMWYHVYTMTIQYTTSSYTVKHVTLYQYMSY